jgi:aspartyl-tRNA(Asn)/glutamyl-tRNA(Gln) amidotransferase subunit A
VFDAKGAVLRDLEFPELREIPALYARGGMLAAEAWQHHRPIIEAHGATYDPRVRARMELAQGTLAADYLDILARRRVFMSMFAERFQGFDAVVMPTVMNIPPAISELADDKEYIRLNGMSLRNTSVGNFLNSCAISIPMHKEGSAPTGFMAMAPWGNDRALFGVAAAFEQTLMPQRQA